MTPNTIDPAAVLALRQANANQPDGSAGRARCGRAMPGGKIDRLYGVRAPWFDFVPIALAVFAVGWMAVQAGPVRAETPDEAVAVIQQQGGGYAPCLLSIASRETGGTFDPYAVNPSSGAYGEFQFLQHGGEWDSTPLGQAGVPVTVTSVAEQVAMAVWAISSGHLRAWAPAPAGC